MSGGFAVLLALAGGVLIVLGIRGTYSDVTTVVLHPTSPKGSEPGGAGLAREPSIPGVGGSAGGAGGKK